MFFIQILYQELLRFAEYIKNYLTQNSSHFIETVLGHSDKYYTVISTQFLDIT